MAFYKCAVHIGEVIINECLDRGISINTSKLMKLLYFMQKLHFQKYGTPMFTDEVVVTKSGPQIQDVANYFIRGRMGFDMRVKQSIILKDSHKDVANTILEEYGNISPSELMKLSQEDELFKIIWAEGKGNNKIIPFKAYYLLVKIKEQPEIKTLRKKRKK